jgi:Orange carotenoid protein, N-terminal
MSYITSNTESGLLNTFQNLEVDQQLAVFYFLYKEMGTSVTPAAPGASTVSPEIAESLFNQVKDLSPDEQLQIQRDLLTGKNSLIAREYGALSDTTKLLFWYRLAQGMDSSTIVPMPSDYKLSEEAEQVFEQVKALEFEKQITLFRNIVSPLGVDPAVAQRDPASNI